MITKLLPEVCKIQYGFAFDSAKFSDSKGTPLVRIRDVVRGYSETYTDEKCSDAYIVQNGDMLIGMDGEFNIARWNGGHALLNQRVCKLMPTEEIDAGYLYYYMPTALKAIEDETPFVTVKHLSAKQLNTIVIPLPEMQQQEHIARMLDNVSRSVSLRKQQLAKLDELVKARFVEMFSGYSETAKLSDVASVTGGLTKNTKRDKLPLRMPYLRVANVAFAAIDVSEMLDIGLTEEECKKTLLQSEDLLFVEGNGSPDQIGRVAIWKNEIVPCVHQNHLIKSRFNKSKVLPVFAMYYFISQKGREQIKSKAVSTSGLYTLSVSKVADLLMPTPPMELQEQFAAFVVQIDKSKLTITESLDKLELLKKALMQKYFEK